MRLELTRRADYSIRAMLALPADGDQFLSGPQIAQAMDIPRRFMGQVMAPLVKAGLVEARTGRSGGYRLAKEAEAISILSVIEASGDRTARGSCVLRGGPCATDGTCAVHSVFEAAHGALLIELRSATLASARQRL
jgi:Rrf2 family protein